MRPFRPITPELAESARGTLAAKIDRRGPDDCWEWTGQRDAKGYGLIRRLGAQWRVTRIALALVGRAPAVVRLVCHHCDNPPCCNPAHLFVGSHADNNADSTRKGRGVRPRGERNGRARLSPEQVAEIRASPLSNRTLGRRFGVAHSTIGHARIGNTWADAPMVRL